MKTDIVFVTANAAGEAKIAAVLHVDTATVTLPMASDADLSVHFTAEGEHFIERCDGTFRHPVYFDADTQSCKLNDSALACHYLPVRVRCISLNRKKAATGADVKVFTLPGFTREAVTDYLVFNELGSNKTDNRYQQLRGKMLANDIREGRYVDSAHERSGVIVYDNYLTHTTTVFTLLDVKGN